MKRRAEAVKVRSRGLARASWLSRTFGISERHSEKPGSTWEAPTKKHGESVRVVIGVGSFFVFSWDSYIGYVS